ncbi:PREDICTED: serine/threonine-protein kinase EDR1-like [Camelina sativa]|uniref:Serine/threonine-protein kinase EDR1-like n=1 Tax=Camelina sativa TaxID=90675 RepID=A0ABM0YAN3_CAMSA|nr:PREDICTED: serine/threonine-protein kinase EDR1-like [Camelina sativa]XP_010498196.1 PREDICTED: serine/threonine-protein kinase EDR1-like [Camelina sativa]XP_019099067.1 PREDICTED: serine/threonine-protein kinase EDR1-like [Camelina sativa]
MKMNMKKFLKKLRITPNQRDDGEGSVSNRSNKSSDAEPSPSDSLRSQDTTHSNNPEFKPFSGLSNWLSSVAQRRSPTTTTTTTTTTSSNAISKEDESTMELGGGSESGLQGLGSTNSKDPEVEEEYQIQLALELSAREDPEAAQIEAMKQFSLGSRPSPPENSPAELMAYRYWNYNCLGYDDKIVDGFYDLCGVMNESSLERIPPLVDLQGTLVSDGVTWDAVLVNRSEDPNLLRLEQKALDIAAKSKSASSSGFVNSELVRKLAVLVADYMGGPVVEPDSTLRAWWSLSYSLKATLRSMVLPLGSLTIGLARHRALLFKVLCDSVGVPCRIVKGQQYTGSDDVAMNSIKTDDGREYIVDLMGDPGTLIPADAAGLQMDYDDSVYSASPRDADSSHVASSSSGVESSIEEHAGSWSAEHRSRTKGSRGENQSEGGGDLMIHPNICREVVGSHKAPVQPVSGKPTHSFTHARSPSWTEGVSSPAGRRMKVKDVSQYMIDAAKENSQLAQKLHDVLLESGVVAPRNLFSEVYSESMEATVEIKPVAESNDEKGKDFGTIQQGRNQSSLGPVRFLPPLPRPQPKTNTHDRREHSGPGLGHLSDDCKIDGQSDSSHSETSTDYPRNVPVAVAAAAVVASSMVVAAAKSANSDSSTLELSAAAAAAVVATAAAVSRQLELDSHSNGDAGSAGLHGVGSGGERKSDRSTGNESSKSDSAIDDVAECEILWEEVTVAERIGLGSYGEVYRGDWHGTAVAVKKFIDQDITGEALEEFRSEVRMMRRLRHPNIVLFMGAVTRPPNLSIVTEFLPRGSLYRLIHRPNNQLDERKRLRMALDAARGMNYLHSCNPVIVHRDLKSPNLLVDKNWVVKVCDFGLSRMKVSTYLSSKSTAGTAEWMAPEVLRNEPADEKCDVYSYGVILWELFTLQQPWGKMNPMQVVGAVGFQHRRLEIPEFVDPGIADIIRKCWQTDPRLRPSFGEIMASLKQLQKPIMGPNNQRAGVPSSSLITDEQEQ